MTELKSMFTFSPAESSARPITLYLVDSYSEQEISDYLYIEKDKGLMMNIT
jgi:hypothetical protein